MFRSEDGGVTWRELAYSFPAGCIIRSLAVSPTNRDVAIAGTAQPTGIWRTADGGGTWVRVLDLSSYGTSYCVHSLRFDSSGNLVLAGLVGYSFGSYGPAFLYRSTNGGGTWAAIRPTAFPSYAYYGLSCLWIDPQRPERVLAGMAGSYDSKNGLFQSTDSGATWALLTTAAPFAGGSAGFPVFDLAQNPQDPRSLYIGTYDSGSMGKCVYKSGDAGATWAPATAAFPGNNAAYRLAVDPQDPATIWAATGYPEECENSSYAAYSSSMYKPLYRSEDGGATWKDPQAGYSIPDHWYYDSTARIKALLATGAAYSPPVLVGSNYGGLWGKKQGENPFNPDNSGMLLANCSTVATAADGMKVVVGVQEQPTINVAGRIGDGWSWTIGDVLSGTVIEGSTASCLVSLTPDASQLCSLFDGIFTSCLDGGSCWAGRPSVYGTCMASAPGDSRHLALGGYGSVSQSTDAGLTWTPGAYGFVGGTPISSIAFGAQPSRLVATSYNSSSVGQGVYLSDDGGATFVPRNTGLPLHQSYSAVTFARPAGSELWVAGDGGLPIKSTDNGDSWTAVSRPPYLYSLTGLEASTSPTRCAYISDYSSIYKTTDGVSWSNITPTGYPSIYGIASSTGDSRIVWILDYSKLYRSADGGVNWSVAAMPESYAYALALDPANDLVAYVSFYDAVYRTTNGGATWTALTMPSGVYDVESLAVVNGTLYLGSYYGLYRSTNAGASWTAWNIARTYNSILQILSAPSDPTRMYLIDESMQIYKSVNSGVTWSACAKPVSTSTYVYQERLLAVSPTNADTLVVSWPDRTLYRSTNGGASWTELRNGLEWAEVTASATHPADNGTIFIGTARDGGFKSTNSGATWVQMAGLPSVSINRIWVNPSNPQELLAATNRGLYRSTNGGASWGTWISALSAFAINDLRVQQIGAEYHLTIATSQHGIWTTLANRSLNTAVSGSLWELYE